MIANYTPNTLWLCVLHASTLAPKHDLSSSMSA